MANPKAPSPQHAEELVARKCPADGMAPGTPHFKKEISKNIGKSGDLTMIYCNMIDLFFFKPCLNHVNHDLT